MSSSTLRYLGVDMSSVPRRPIGRTYPAWSGVVNMISNRVEAPWGHTGSERGRRERHPAVYKPPVAGTLMGTLTDSTSPSTLQRITSSTLLPPSTNHSSCLPGTSHQTSVNHRPAVLTALESGEHPDGHCA